jgi:hypothetical protein
MSVQITVAQGGLQGPAGTDGTDASPDASDIILFDDFISNTIVGNIGWTNSNASGGTASIVASESNHSGIGSLSTGVAGSVGYSNIFLGSNTIFLGNGVLDLEFLIRLPTLSTSSERYIVRIGLGDTVNADHSIGAWFEYDESTSANWRYCVNNGGSATKATSSIAVTENAWIKLKISINADASSITFYVDGTSIGSVTSGFSTSGFGPRLHIFKSVGSSARFLNIDYFSLVYSLTNSR